MPSVVTYNVGAGNLFPFFQGGRRALVDNSRLDEQLAAIAALDADIICLQDVTSDKLRRAYHWNFGGTHGCVFQSQAPSNLARACGELLYIFTASSLATVVYATGLSSCSWSCIVALYGLCYLLSRACLRDSALCLFLYGSVRGGLVVLYRRDLFGFVRAETVPFVDQALDVLSDLRPKCFQVVELRQATAPNPKLFIVHAHCGARGGAQVAEAASVAADLYHAASVGSDVLLLGDFSEEEARAGDGEEIVELLANYGLCDTAILAHGAGALGEPHRGAHMFQRGRSRVVKRAVVFEQSGDHGDNGDNGHKVGGLLVLGTEFCLFPPRPAYVPNVSGSAGPDTR